MSEPEGRKTKILSIFYLGLTFFHRNLIPRQFLHCWVPPHLVGRNSCSQFERLALHRASSGHCPRAVLEPAGGTAAARPGARLRLLPVLPNNRRPVPAPPVTAAGWTQSTINHIIIILTPKWAGIFLLKMVNTGVL